MGIPYLFSLINNYPGLSTSPPQRVDLKGRAVIVDRNSTMYAIYDQAVIDDKTRSKTEQVTKTPFGYDKYRKLLYDLFFQLREKCTTVIVVSDGVYRRHPRRRSDPDRMSSLRFAALSENGNQLPALAKCTFDSVLNELDMHTIVARGEADPMIAEKARTEEAYVVADDSDYHLYDLLQGYVPIRSLNVKQLKGSLYQRQNVFEGMDAREVALWATLIGYDFVSWDNLQVRLIHLLFSYSFPSLNIFQKLFVNFEPHDAQEFHLWLESANPDREKHLRMTSQFYLIRLIQENGGLFVQDKAIQFIPEAQRTEFHQLKSSYIGIHSAQSIQTRGQKELPRYIDDLFVSGHLDIAIINLFTNRKLLLFTESDNPAFYRFLSPVIQLALKWDRPDAPTNNCSSIIFNKEQYYPMDSVNEDELPSADEVKTMSTEEKKKCLLSCVQSALESHMIVGTDRIPDEQLVFLCLLKLWYHQRQEPSTTRDTVLRAMIVSYLKYKLLADANQPVSEFAKHLRENLSPEECKAISEVISKTASIEHDNEEIKKELLEFERFYQVFHIANQFFARPLTMPDPSEFGIEEAYYLAINISRSQDPDREISKRLFKSDQTLTRTFTEFQEIVKQGPPSTADDCAQPGNDDKP